MSRNKGVSTQDLTDRKSVRVTLFFVIPTVIFILVCAAIRISQYGIDHTIIVLGQKELVSEKPGAVRVTLISESGNYFLPSRISGHLVRGTKRYKLFDGPCNEDGYSLARNFTVPKMSPGPAKLEFGIEFDERKRTVDADVTIVTTGGREHLVIPSDILGKPTPNPVSKDGGLVSVFTEGRGAPTGLSSVVFLRTQGDLGKPISIPLEIEPPSGDSKIKSTKQIESDVIGLFALPAKPMELSWPIRVMGSTRMVDGKLQPPPEGTSNPGAYLHPKIVYAGLSAVLHNPMASQGDRLKVSARQLSSAGPLYVDLFKEGSWVQAGSSWFAGGSSSVEITPSFTGLGRMQITSSVIAPGKTIVVRHFYVLGENESPTDGLRSVLKQLESSSLDGQWASAALELPLERGTGFDRRQANAFAFSRLYKGHSPIPTLIHSRRTDDTELKEFKGRFQRMVMMAILLIGFGVAALIVMVAVRAHRTQQRVTLMIMADDPDQDGDLGEPTTDDPSSVRRRAILQGVVLFLIIMGAFISVAILVDTLTWGR